MAEGTKLCSLSLCLSLNGGITRKYLDTLLSVKVSAADASHTSFTRKIFHGFELRFEKEAKMLDFFSIFSKGGILLWCFKGIGLDEKDWASFTPAVNAFIKTVLLQVRSHPINFSFFFFKKKWMFSSLGEK